jgi:EAL domain-containing protein (putative c-di-GMP-specific phosphodiesterase class I)
VKDIVADPINLAMVKSINDIGQVMGKRTIAEFVENDGILEKLREVGVDYAQGYRIGRPTPLERLLSREPEDEVLSDSFQSSLISSQ